MPLTASRAGGTPVLNQNGNRWVGAGHNAIATDLAGQDWIAYHAIDRDRPLPRRHRSGINERPMLLDRLDWVDGWPAVRAGQGPSERSQQAPVTGGRVATTFSRGDGDRLRRPAAGPRAGRPVRHVPAVRPAGAVLTRSSVTGDVRAEADLRSSGAAYGLVVSDHGKDATRLVIDPGPARQHVRQDGGAADLAHGGCRPGLDVRRLALRRARAPRATVTAQLSNARLGDPVVDLRLTAVPRPARAGRAGAIAAGPGSASTTSASLPAARR